MGCVLVSGSVLGCILVVQVITSRWVGLLLFLTNTASTDRFY